MEVTNIPEHVMNILIYLEAGLLRCGAVLVLFTDNEI